MGEILRRASKLGDAAKPGLGSGEHYGIFSLILHPLWDS